MLAFLVSLEKSIQKVLEFISSTYRISPQESEVFPTLEEKKQQLQLYAFMQRFTLAS